MNIEDSKPKFIYRSELNNKTYYRIGIIHKLQNGSYESGYLLAKFPKGTNLENKTKITIINAWLDFYIKDKKTVPYIFINKYELVNDTQSNNNLNYEDINISESLSDEDLPF